MKKYWFKTVITAVVTGAVIVNMSACATSKKYVSMLEQPSAQKLAEGHILHCEEFGKEIEWRKKFVNKINENLSNMGSDSVWLPADCSGSGRSDWIVLENGVIVLEGEEGYE